MGKPMLAEAVMSRLASLLGMPSWLEVTVEEDGALDMSDFQFQTQAGVILDGIGEALTLKRHRETLQGRPKKCKGGKSATMMYSYEYTLYGRGVIAAFGLSAKHLAHLATDHWLSNSKNVIALRLTEPAWVHSQVLLGQAPARSHAGIMSEWGVGDVARWLEDADMEGTAAIFKAEGVSGKDVLAFVSAESMTADLRLSPFAARKVWGYRAASLAGDASA